MIPDSVKLIMHSFLLCGALILGLCSAALGHANEEASNPIHGPNSCRNLFVKLNSPGIHFSSFEIAELNAHPEILNQIVNLIQIEKVIQERLLKEDTLTMSWMKWWSDNAKSEKQDVPASSILESSLGTLLDHEQQALLLELGQLSIKKKKTQLDNFIILNQNSILNAINEYDEKSSYKYKDFSIVKWIDLSLKNFTEFLETVHFVQQSMLTPETNVHIRRKMGGRIDPKLEKIVRSFSDEKHEEAVNKFRKKMILNLSFDENLLVYYEFLPRDILFIYQQNMKVLGIKNSMNAAENMNTWVNLGNLMLIKLVLSIVHDLRYEAINLHQAPNKDEIHEYILKKVRETFDFQDLEFQSNIEKMMIYVCEKELFEQLKIRNLLLVDELGFQFNTRFHQIRAVLREHIRTNEKEKKRLRELEQKNQSLPVVPTNKVESISSKLKKAQKDFGSMVKGLVRKTNEQKEDIATKAPEIKKQLLPENALDLNSLLQEGALFDLSQRYYFDGSFNDSPKENIQYHFVVFTKAFYTSLKHHQQALAPWLRAFLHGPVAKDHSTGLKRLLGRKNLLWEVKIVSSDYRVILLQDKATKKWKWLDLVKHDKVADYITQNRL